MKNPFSALLSKEPAVTLGVFFSLVAYIAHAVADAPAASTWTALGPIVVGAVIRFFVFSPASVQSIEDEAHITGVAVGERVTKESARQAQRERRARAKSQREARPAATRRTTTRQPAAPAKSKGSKRARTTSTRY